MRYLVHLTALLLVFVTVASKHTWTVRRDWNALGTHGTKEKVKDLESCMSKAEGHAQFSFAQDSNNCYYSDDTSFGGSGDSHVTSGCVAQKVKNCGGPAKDDWWTVTTDWNSLGTSGKRKDAEDLAECLKYAHGHAQFSFAKDSGHCYFSDTKQFGGKSFSKVTSGCVAGEVKGCPGTPAPPPIPVKPWAQFANQAALQQSPWAKYFTGVYGELPSSYPLRVSDFWCFYTDKMQAAGVGAPASVGKCPTSVSAPEGQRYDSNNAYSSPDLTWVWHPLSSTPPYTGFPSNSVVEVSHHKDPFGDEHYGLWFLYAKGTGVYFQLGNTKIFNNHDDAYTYFGAVGPKYNEDMCRKAAAKGYDSIQFIQHPDGVNYPCAKGIGASWMNMEIVAVKLVGTYACGQAQGTPASLRAGWNGNKPCKCDPSNPNTNCQG